MISAIIVLILSSIPGDVHLVRSNPVNSDVGCSILINGGLSEPQPLILRPGTRSGLAIPRETGTGSLFLLKGESLRIDCPGLGNKLDIESTREVAEANVTCMGSSDFYFDDFDFTVPFEEIVCKNYPTHTARSTGVSCPNGKVCEIGFDLGTDDFRTLITACHDNASQHTISAHAKVVAVIDSAQKSFPRPQFVKGDFYAGVSMTTIYTRINQRATLAKIVGSESLALQYMPETGNFYLAKGHLVAKMDFIYGSHQRATFYYLNTVPTWQNVNAGNWEKIEANVRNLATDQNVDLDVWSGSIGILTLPDINGDEQQLHLYIDDNDNRAVPVPKLLFKVVYAEQSRRGVVFVTANNPYLTTLTSDYVVCSDICDQLTYLTRNATSGTHGFSYCCEIDDFRKAFDGIPHFKTKGILR